MEDRRIGGLDGVPGLRERLSEGVGGFLTGGFRLEVREGRDDAFALPRASFTVSRSFFSLAPLVRAFFLSFVSGCRVRMSVLL